jgi:hypothetical protein
MLMNKPYDVWANWFRLRCTHDCDPTAEEAWDGAVETVAHFVENYLSGKLPEDELSDLWCEINNQLKR